MLDRIRIHVERWLFRQLAKILEKAQNQKIEDLECELLALKEKYAEQDKYNHLFASAITEAAKLTGGEGWVQTVQNAIAALDSKVDTLYEAAQEQQDAIEELSRERETTINTSLGIKKPD